ncbi:MAG TPA: hypothetical protein VFS09_11965 [Candidatus Eisenbacteria bacterium]|nr:hypothetical protein [Candidatus Eisenbacteria bacterium]
MMRPSSIVLVLTAFIFLRPASAVAGFPGDIPDKFRIEVAGTTATLDTEVGLGTETGGLNATLVFEDLFNLPIHDGYFQAEGSWKCGGRSHIDLGYIDVNRTAERVIAENVEFGKYTFTAGAQVEAFFGSRFGYLAYRHDFLQHEDVRISGSFGLSNTKLSARLSSEGGVLDENQQPVVGGRTVEGKLTLPVPLLGIQLDWAVSKRSDIQFFSRVVFINLPDLRGGMSQNTIRYHYWVVRNAALGVGYDGIRCALQKYRNDDYTLRANYGIQGFTFYLRGAF